MGSSYEILAVELCFILVLHLGVFFFFRVFNDRKISNFRHDGAPFKYNIEQ